MLQSWVGPVVLFRVGRDAIESGYCWVPAGLPHGFIGINVSRAGT